eukprot:NODE_65_length_23997_cov_0.327601.p7 type:complete len:353 gc:universal NODE_65_length_23997_cov_0.327601:18612-17554(-)
MSTNSFLEFLNLIKSVAGDLSHIAAPSILLNGFSMTEYSKYWMDHPSLIDDIELEKDPEKRIICVCKWFLSTLQGSYSSRGYELKPYNPILGEHYSATAGNCKIVTEQVSHHPPITAFQIHSGKISIHGHIQPFTTFKGSHVLVSPKGRIMISIDGDQYLVSLPVLALRGLYQIRPYFEILDKVYISSKSGYNAVFEFVPKGYFSGDYNTFNCTISSLSGSKIAEINGNWTTESKIQFANSSSAELFYDTALSKPVDIAPIESSDPLFVYNVWGDVTRALESKEYEKATDLKLKIEDHQRQLKKKELFPISIFKFAFDNEDSDISTLVERIGYLSGGDLRLTSGHYVFINKG